MNKVGIGLYAFALLLGAGAMYLGAQVYDARSQRLAQIGGLREEAIELEKQLLQEELAVKSKQSAFISAQQIWGRVWNGVPQASVINAPTGLIELGIGKDAGLGAAESAMPGAPLPSVHVFALNGQDSDYMGEFQLNGVDAKFAAAQLKRPPLPGETQSWSGEAYRVRTLAPAAYAGLYRELATDYQIAQQSLAAQQNTLADVQAQAESAREQIAARTAELLGSANNPMATEEVKQGLVESLRQTEATRNASASRVAELRADYFDRTVEFRERLDEIRELAGQLPGANRSRLPVDVSANPTN